MENREESCLFRSIESVLSQSTEQSVETQISLPEYCSDIRKILKCMVVPNIFACGISGDRVTASGEAVIRVIYNGEGGIVECCEQSVPFSKYIEFSCPDGDCSVKATAKTEYVNCRAVSQRRISVSASVSVHFCVQRVKKERLFSACENTDFETRGDVLSCTMPLCICEKPFEMSETALLPESSPSVSAFINNQSCAVIDSVKTISGKMLIKGDMITDILYCTDSENREIEKYRHTMPISQIVDLEGVDENSLCQVNITVLSVCVSVKADSEGNNRLIDICVKSSASVSAYENCDICTVSDGYSTKYETDSEFRNLIFRNHIYTYKETKQIRANIDMSGLEAAVIAEAFPVSCDAKAESAEGKTVGSGEVPIGIIYKGTDGEYGYTEKTIDFSFESKGSSTGERVIAEPEFTLGEINASMLSQASAEIRMSVGISMPIFEEYEKRVCTKLEIIEEREKPQCECPITVYYPSEGEKLWDIAKKYNTSCDRIREDNDLSSDEVSDRKMLLICSA